MPRFAAFMMLVRDGQLGLPAPAAFVGEFYVISARSSTTSGSAWQRPARMITRRRLFAVDVQAVIFGEVPTSESPGHGHRAPRESFVLPCWPARMLWMGV